MNTHKAYTELKAWFDSGKDLKVGMKLHTHYSKNHANKMQLAKYPAKRKQLLPVYLLDIFNQCKPTDVEKISLRKQIVVIPPVTRREDIETKLRNEFEKLEFKELPKPLQLLVIKRYDAWKESKEQHALLHTAETDQDRYEAVRACVLAIKENWGIWDELTEFHQKGNILGLHPDLKQNDFDLKIQELQKQSSEVYTKEFMKLRMNLAKNIKALIKKYDGNIPQSSQETLDFNIYKFNVVSTKLKEPLWKEVQEQA